MYMSREFFIVNQIYPQEIVAEPSNRL